MINLIPFERVINNHLLGIQNSLLETDDFLTDLQSDVGTNPSDTSSIPNDQSLLDVMFPIPGDATSDTSPLSVDQLQIAAERYREFKQSAKQKDDKHGLMKSFDTLAAISRALNAHPKVRQHCCHLLCDQPFLLLL